MNTHARPQARGGDLHRYLESIASTPVPTDDEVAELVRTLRDRSIGTEARIAARNRLVEGNLRLVVSVVQLYRSAGVAVEDLIAEGNVGLLRAVKGFKPDMGVKFSSYAPYWIRAAVQQAISRQTRPVRLPDYMHWLLRHYEQAKLELTDQLGRAPTLEEVRKHLNLPPTRAQFLVDALVTAEACRPPSVGSEPAEIEPPDREDSPDVQAERNDRGRWVEMLLKRLPERHAYILRRRLKRDKSLAAVGLELGITRERIRQLEAEALAMMRAAAYGRSTVAAGRAVRAERKRLIHERRAARVALAGDEPFVDDPSSEAHA